MNRTYIESLDKQMIFAAEDIQYVMYVKTGYNNREHDYVKVVIANQYLEPITLKIHAEDKDYDKVLKPWYNKLKDMLGTREVKSNG